MTTAPARPAAGDAVVLDDPRDLAEALSLFAGTMVGLPFGLFDHEGIHEPGRALGVFEDGELAGTVNSYATRLTIPGGAELPHAAVTHVGVRATHRRRGIARRLLAAQLRRARQAGDVLAGLRASQPGIYERYGYGVASQDAEVVLDLRTARLRPLVRGAGPLREVPIAGSRELQRAIHDRWGRRAAGAVSRPEPWWRVMRVDDPVPQNTLVVHGAPGREDGYVRFRPLDTDHWWHSSQRTVLVEDLVAATDEAWVALVGHVLALDLVHRVILHSVPVDHPLGDLLTDVRALETLAVRDETWLRLLDVGAALAARAYNSGGRLVIEVVDDLIDENNARFAVGDGAPAAPTDAAPDLVADVDALGAVFLGRPAWRALELSGRVRVRTPGALERAERLFATPAAPYAGTVF